MPLDMKPRRSRRSGLRRRSWLDSHLGDAVLIAGSGLIAFLILYGVVLLLWSAPGQDASALGQNDDTSALPTLPTVTPAAADFVLLPDGPPQAETDAAQTPTAATQPTIASSIGGNVAAPPPIILDTPPTEADLRAAAAIDDYVNGLVSDGVFSGAILVARNGAVVLNRGYGMANAEQNIANTPQTRFRLASLTKPFTAMAVLMLHHRGELHIYDPICIYLPECPETWRDITIRHLLSHTSGIPNYTDFLDYETTEMQRTAPEQLIARFKDLPLLEEPGFLYRYNNSGYVLLGVIIERVSGQSYEAFLQENIFDPLQMLNTGYDHNANAIQDGQALGYTTPGFEAPFLDASTLHASGSLYSTVEDMYRWDQALYSEYFVPATLRDEMFTPVQYGYGYGWKIDTWTGQLRYSHPGFINGFSNYIARYPEERMFVIVLSNAQNAPAQAMTEQIARIMTDNR